ncbi:MAG: CHAT domain-containing protein [Muribaculaceae bacterium]
MKKVLIFLISASAAIFAAPAQSLDEIIDAARTEAEAKNYSRAIYLYDEVLKADGSDDATLYNKYRAHTRLCGIYLFNAPDYPQAARHGLATIDYLEAGACSEVEDINFALMVAYVYQALCYYCLDDSAAFDSYAAKAMKHLEVVETPEQASRAAVMSAMLFRRASRLDLTLEYYKRAIEIGRTADISHEEMLSNLNNYANTLYALNRYDEAYEVYKEQQGLSLQYYGRDSNEYRWATYVVANILAYKGDIAGGCAILREVIHEYISKMRQQLRTIPSDMREALLGEMINIVQNMTPFGAKAGCNDDEFTRDAYEGLLLTKGLLLASERSAQSIIAANGSDDDIECFRRLGDLRQKLSSIESDAERSVSEVMALSDTIRSLDARLAAACARYGDISAFAEIGFDDIRRSLRPGEVLLDFADYKPNGKPRRYVCYEVRADRQYPHVHHICTGEAIDSLLALEHNVPSNIYSGESGAALSRLVAERIAAIADSANASVIYYVPSGIIHKLAFDAISYGDATLGDRYRCHRLSSARELTLQSADSDIASATIYGGLDYDNDATRDLNEARKLQPLRQSSAEVDDIARNIGADVALTIYKDAAGTAASFEALDGHAPDMLHFSTHGFYYTPADADKPASLKGYNDAMHLSGLVLSGGNAGWLGIQPGEGLLSAADIARRDLRGMRLVSLASCYSGEGDVTSEGIYGLQRAFKKAGVSHIIVSLWQASDVASKCFMTNFYADLITGSKDVRSAFAFARNCVRTKYPDPSYWAGFVLID